MLAIRKKMLNAIVLECISCKTYKNCDLRKKFAIIKNPDEKQIKHLKECIYYR